MGFPPVDRMYVGDLVRATPTPYTKEVLAEQLGNVGLDCAMLQGQNLDEYINNVKRELYAGNIKTMAILQSIPRTYSAEELKNLSPLQRSMARDLEESATGNWTMSDSAQGYAKHLQIIQYPEHFEYLYDNRATNGFTGVTDEVEKEGNYDNSTAIQELFIEAGQSASQTLVEGLDEDSMLASLTNAIQPLSNEDLDDYEVPENSDDPWPSQVLYLVHNYDPATRYADGIGVLYYSWTLRINQYLRKDKDGGNTHDTYLKVKSGSVLYGNPNDLCRDYNDIAEHFEFQQSDILECPVQIP